MAPNVIITPPTTSKDGGQGVDQGALTTLLEKNDQKPKGQKLEVLFEGYLYDVTEWVRRHPGGKVIEFYTLGNEDATLAIKQFHLRSEKKVMGILKSLSRRPVSSATSQKSPEVPELDEPTKKRHQALTDDFTKLYRELEVEGYFKPSPVHLALRFLEIFLIGALAAVLSSYESWLCRVPGHFLVMLFSTRCGFLQHEGGHHGLTGYPRIDRFLQALSFGVGLGLSSSWWTSQHNRHHAMTQRLKRDPDLDTLPLLAFNAKCVKNPQQGKNFLIKNQAILFLAIDTLLVVIFWKLFLHPRTAIKKHMYHELAFMTFHYFLLIYFIGFWGYLVAAWLTSIYIFGTFSLSHTHLSVTDQPLHWVEYALCHTQDIDSSWFCDWATGFLNCQIEHHLFPTMPEFRNRLVKGRVKALAEKHGIPYNCMTYGEAVYKTYRNLADVSTQLIQEHKATIARKRGVSLHNKEKGA